MVNVHLTKEDIINLLRQHNGDLPTYCDALYGYDKMKPLCDWNKNAKNFLADMISKPDYKDEILVETKDDVWFPLVITIKHKTNDRYDVAFCLPQFLITLVDITDKGFTWWVYGKEVTFQGNIIKKNRKGSGYRIEMVGCTEFAINGIYCTDGFVDGKVDRQDGWTWGMVSPFNIYEKKVENILEI